MIRRDLTSSSASSKKKGSATSACISPSASLSGLKSEEEGRKGRTARGVSAVSRPCLDSSSRQRAPSYHIWVRICADNPLTGRGRRFGGGPASQVRDLSSCSPVSLNQEHLFFSSSLFSPPLVFALDLRRDYIFFFF